MTYKPFTEVNKSILTECTVSIVQCIRVPLEPQRSYPDHEIQKYKIFNYHSL